MTSLSQARLFSDHPTLGVCQVVVGSKLRSWGSIPRQLGYWPSTLGLFWTQLYSVPRQNYNTYIYIYIQIPSGWDKAFNYSFCCYKIDKYFIWASMLKKHAFSSSLGWKICLLFQNRKMNTYVDCAHAHRCIFQVQIKCLSIFLVFWLGQPAWQAFCLRCVYWVLMSPSQT